MLPRHDDVVRRQQVFGYTEEELRVLLEPMARTGAEPTGSMGTDTPVAVLSERPRLLFDYFSQLFAQVTNPPLDAIREELVTSLQSTIGPDTNLLAESPAACRKVVLPFPVLDNDELAKLVHIAADGDLPGLAGSVVSGLYEVDGGGEALAAAAGAGPGRGGGRHRGAAPGSSCCPTGAATTAPPPIPSLLLIAAVHHHLVRTRLRTKVGLVVESGDCREVHHMALLLGYGAAAVNPYLAFETVEDLVRAGRLSDLDRGRATANLAKALGKGVLKVMSKMGISTVASYTGAQVFEALGLGQPVVDDYFTGTASRLGGVGLDVLAAEVAARHRTAYPATPTERAHRRLEVGGEYTWRREGEVHLFNPETVFLLQHATRSRRYDVYRRYTAEVDELSRRAATLRGLFELRRGRAPAGAARRGRAGRRDRQALLHRRHVVRVDLGGGARDAGRRDEHDRRPVQLRRGRRGLRPAARPAAAQRRQAGRQRPLRRDQRVPGLRRRPADQDGAGREARRGRPAARLQGVPVDRQDPALHPRGRPDQPAAAPRHLLDRGPGAAHPRPEERQPAKPGCTSSWWPRSASARSPPACPRRTPTWC